MATSAIRRVWVLSIQHQSALYRWTRLSFVIALGESATSIPVYQLVRRTIVRQFRRALAFQLRRNPIRQHLAQLHAPLIERVDVPDRALDENAVLIQGDNLSQS